MHEPGFVPLNVSIYLNITLFYRIVIYLVYFTSTIINLNYQIIEILFDHSLFQVGAVIIAMLQTKAVLDVVPPAVPVMWVLTEGGGEGCQSMLLSGRYNLEAMATGHLATGMVSVLSAGPHLPRTRELLRPSS